ncbi:MAG: hypothetical protein RIC35_15545 [Marinoscillum sp.]
MRAFFYTVFFLCIEIGVAQNTSVEVGLLASTETMSWSIAGNLKGTNPNIYSELAWAKIMGAGIGASLDQLIYKRMSIGLDLNLISYLSGHVTDTDYRDDNRQNQTFYAREQANKGGSRLVRSNLEFKVIDRSKLDFSVGVGYGLIRKKYYLINKENGLNSSYDVGWFGPNLSTNINIKRSKIYLQLQTDYCQASYLATGNWNLIDDFEHPESFRHEAKGFQLSSEVSGGVGLSSNFDLIVRLRHSFFSTGRGIDTLYKTDGSRPKTRLNDVTNEVFGLGLGVKYVF